MKGLKVKFLILPFLFLACTNQKTINENCVTCESGFFICQDTIFVDIKGEMTHALKYQDKLYIIFDEYFFKYSNYNNKKKWLYVFSNGEIERIVDIPKKMDAFYWDFFVKNDSVIIKQYMDKLHFYFDKQNFIWKEIDNADDLIFEDEKFCVYSLDFGEWGGKTWFKNKNTGIEYLIESKTPLINKIDTTYYLTDLYRILKIENPEKLNICIDDVTYENIEKTKKYYSWYGEPIGFDMIYSDLDTICIEDYTFIMPQEINIETSFVWQNELLHIYKTDTATYITKIENNSIKPIQKIEEELSFYNKHYVYRCRNLNSSNELLRFKTKNENTFGLIEIIENKIHIHYFSNRAELKPKPHGTERADSIFINRINLIHSELSNLKLNDTYLQEKKWDTFCSTSDYFILGTSFYPNQNGYDLDIHKLYFIEEDSLISNTITYYATQADDLIRVVHFEWEETNILRRDLDKLSRDAFISKINFLETFFNQKFGHPVYVLKEKNKRPQKIWKTPNGLTIKLIDAIQYEMTYNNIRLSIYKD